MRGRERERRKAEQAEAREKWLKARREQQEAAQQHSSDAERREAMRRARGAAEWKARTEARQRAEQEERSNKAFLESRTDQVILRDTLAKQRKEAFTEHAERRARKEGKLEIRRMAEERALAEKQEAQKRLEARRAFQQAQRRKAAERELERERAQREADERLATEALLTAQRFREEARQTAERARQAQHELALTMRGGRSPEGVKGASTALVLAGGRAGEGGAGPVARTAREERMQQLFGSVLSGQARAGRPGTDDAGTASSRARGAPGSKDNQPPSVRAAWS